MQVIVTVDDLLPNSTHNPRDLTFHGTRDQLACSEVKITVTYIDADKLTISTDGPKSANFNDDDWDFTLDTPLNATTCRIDVFCGDVLQFSLDNIGF